MGILGVICTILKSRYWLSEHIVITIMLCAHGAVGHCPVESQEEDGFLFFVGGGKPSSTYFGRMDDNRISGISYCGYHGSASSGGSACCRYVSVCYELGFPFPGRLQTYVCLDGLLGAARSGYTSWCPLLAQGHSIWPGRGSLEVTVLDNSFSRPWADERQLGQKKR